jgi:hypothetical protein
MGWAFTSLHTEIKNRFQRSERRKKETERTQEKKKGKKERESVFQ